MQAQPIPPQERSFASLLKDLSQETSILARKEVSLARVEISDKVSQVGANIASLAVATAILLAGFIVALDAAVIGLAEFTPADYDWLAPLIVGAVVLLIGFIMLQKSKNNLKPANLAPSRTTESIHQDKEFIKERAQ